MPWPQIQCIIIVVLAGNVIWAGTSPIYSDSTCRKAESNTGARRRRHWKEPKPHAISQHSSQVATEPAAMQETSLVGTFQH